MARTGRTRAEKTASQRGRASVDRGKETERKVAYHGLVHYWPTASRGRDNGSAWTPDRGDIVGTAPWLFWSVKGDRTAQIGAWMTEMRDKARPGQMSVLVERRDWVANPLRWWAWVWSDHFAHRIYDRDITDGPPVPIRLELGHLCDLLARRGLTPTRIEHVAEA